jgi:hypothetical protein
VGIGTGYEKAYDTFFGHAVAKLRQADLSLTWIGAVFKTLEHNLSPNL